MRVETWGLRIVMGANTIDLFGTEELMRAGFEQLIDSKHSGDPEVIVVLDGCFNTYDRAQRKLAIVVSDIHSFELFQAQ